MTMSVNPYAGLGSVKESERNPTFARQPGIYTLAVAKMEIKDTREYGTTQLVEFDIVESSNLERPKGTKAAWFLSIVPKDKFLPKVKNFIRSVLGIEISDVESMTDLSNQIEGLAMAGVNENVFKGRRVQLQVSIRKSKENKDYTHYQFSPLNETFSADAA